MSSDREGAPGELSGLFKLEVEEDHSTRRPWWCFPLLAAAVLSVSSAGAVFKKLPDVPPITLAAWRLQLTSLFLAAGLVPQWRAMPAADRRRALSRPDVLWTALSGACLAVHFGAWVASLKLTSLPHALLLVCMVPVLLVIWALLRRQPISKGEVLGTLLALAGAFVLAAGAATGSEGNDVTVWGDVLAFAAAVAVVGYLQIGAKLREYQPPFVYAAPVTGLAALLLSLGALLESKGSFIGADRHGVIGWVASAEYAPYIIWLGTVSGIVGHTGFNTLLKYFSTLFIGLAIQLEPLFGPIIGWAIGVMSAPSAYTWGGGAVVLVASCIVLVASSRRQEAEDAGRCRRQRSLAPARGPGGGGGGGVAGSERSNDWGVELGGGGRGARLAGEEKAGGVGAGGRAGVLAAAIDGADGETLGLLSGEPRRPGDQQEPPA